MSPDPLNKSVRQFQCRDYLWETFEQMSQEFDCSMDYLLNEAMRMYAVSRDRGGPQAQVPEQPDSLSQGRQGGMPGFRPGMQGGPMGGPNRMPPGQPGMQGNPNAMRGPSAGQPMPSQMGARPQMPGMPPQMPGMGQQPAARMPSMGGQPGMRPGMPQPPGMPGMQPGMQPGMRPPGGMPGMSQQPPPQQRMPQPPPPQQRMPGMGPGPGRTLVAIFEGQQYPVTKEEFVIGRGQKTSDLTIRDSNVSRRHACVVLYNGQHWIVDQQSTNGIEYNTGKVERKVIEDGDVFRICDHEIQFVYR